MTNLSKAASQRGVVVDLHHPHVGALDLEHVHVSLGQNPLVVRAHDDVDALLESAAPAPSAQLKYKLFTVIPLDELPADKHELLNVFYAAHRCIVQEAVIRRDARIPSKCLDDVLSQCKAKNEPKLKFMPATATQGDFSDRGNAWTRASSVAEAQECHGQAGTLQAQVFNLDGGITNDKSAYFKPRRAFSKAHGPGLQGPGLARGVAG